MKIIKMIYHLFVDNKLSTSAGALCFFILINGGSYFFLFVNISGYLPVDFNNIILDFINSKELTKVVDYLYDYNKSMPQSIFLILSSIYTSSTLYYHFLIVTDALRKNRYYFNQRIVALILVPCVLFLYLIILILVSKIRILGNIIYLAIVGVLLLFTIYVLNVIALRRFKGIIKGVLIGFFFDIIFTYLFILFLSLSGGFKIYYGAFSFYIIVLFYLYVSVIGILLGITYNYHNFEV